MIEKSALTSVQPVSSVQPVLMPIATPSGSANPVPPAPTNIPDVAQVINQSEVSILSQSEVNVLLQNSQEFGLHSQEAGNQEAPGREEFEEYVMDVEVRKY